MVTEFKFPDVGEGVTEGTLIKWLVEEGDEVEEDESLAEVETDKAVVEIPSPENATVLKLHAGEGDTIKVGNVIVTLGAEGETPSDTAESDESESADEQPSEPTDSQQESVEEASISDMTVDEVKEEVEAGEISASDALEAEQDGKRRKTLLSWLEDEIEEESSSSSVVGQLDEPEEKESVTVEDEEGESTTLEVEEAADTGSAQQSQRVLAAPSTRKLAREKDIDITQVEGSGPGGRVTRDDVLNYAEGGREEPAASQQGESGKVLATPATRRLAKENDVDINSIQGSGPDGRVREEDVLKAAEGEAVGQPASEGEEAAEPDKESVGVRGGLGTPNRFPPREYDFEKYGDVERVEMSGTRKAIAKNMERSKYTAPHVTSTDDADVTELWEVREKEKEVAASRDVHLTFLPFIVKACIAAMRDYPLMNASLDETTGEIVKKDYYNIGIAVATEDGLMVPNIKNADSKSILKIAKEMNELATKAREHELTLEEMKGGTFTITNYGSIGGKYGTPILNYPEVAILGTGTISKEPVVKNGDIHIRRMLPLSVSFDHRVVDGAYVAQFMNELIKHLEDPDLLLLDE